MTDRFLLEYADRYNGQGWEKVSYKFACSFIHLSILHNWTNEDVTAIIDDKEKRIIIDYINSYHGANLNIESSFTDIVQHSLDVFSKIKGNLDYYLEAIEDDVLKGKTKGKTGF